MRDRDTESTSYLHVHLLLSPDMVQVFDSIQTVKCWRQFRSHLPDLRERLCTFHEKAPRIQAKSKPMVKRNEGRFQQSASKVHRAFRLAYVSRRLYSPRWTSKDEGVEQIPDGPLIQHGLEYSLSMNANRRRDNSGVWVKR